MDVKTRASCFASGRQLHKEKERERERERGGGGGGVLLMGVAVL
jgi:hypothetical protein